MNLLHPIHQDLNLIIDVLTYLTDLARILNSLWLYLTFLNLGYCAWRISSGRLFSG